MLFLVNSNNIPPVIEDDKAGTGGTLIYGSNIFLHGLLPWR